LDKKLHRHAANALRAVIGVKVSTIRESDNGWRFAAQMRCNGEVVDLAGRDKSSVVNSAAGVQPPVLSPRMYRSFDTVDRGGWGQSVSGAVANHGLSFWSLDVVATLSAVAEE
jgi:hypothetical protein